MSEGALVEDTPASCAPAGQDGACVASAMDLEGNEIEAG